MSLLFTIVGVVAMGFVAAVAAGVVAMGSVAVGVFVAVVGCCMDSC